MSFLRYYGADAPDRELPARVYARVDTREPPDGERDEERLLLFDSIDADWFDNVRGEVTWLGSFPDTDWRVSVVEMHLERNHQIREERTPEGAWLVLEFDRAGFEVIHYMNLFAAGVTRSASGFYRPDEGVEADLERVTGFGDLPDATPAEIAGLLPQGRTEAAAVYDVGQGNANALLEHGQPVLYYDLGGGVLGNRHTFPAGLTHFCQSFDPLIVLSHWDWDHWSSAQRDVRALKRSWVVPRQRIGPTHTAFLGRLHASGRVIVWPAGLPAAGGGDVRIERCTGPPSSRNDTGLALVWEPDRGRMLFPGDSAYTHVPSAGLDWTSVVVPHHGGRTSLKLVAASDGRAAGRLAWSYGTGNRYQHPLPQVVQAHAGGWAQQLQTPTRGPAGLGHVHLYWDPADPDAPPPCAGANCELTLQQR